MDLYITLRELNELISRTQAAVAEAAAALKSLRASPQRDEKQRQLRAMRVQLRRLRNQRNALMRKPGASLTADSSKTATPAGCCVTPEFHRRSGPRNLAPAPIHHSISA